MRTGEPVRGAAAAAAAGFLRCPPAAPPPGPAGPYRQSPRSLISGPYPLRRPHQDPLHSPEGKMRTGEPVRGPAAAAAAGFLSGTQPPHPRPHGTALPIAQAPN